MWLIVLLLAAVVFIVFSTTKLKLHPFLALLLAAFGYGILCGKMSLEDVVTSVNAVLRNKFPMLVWLTIIVASLVVGVVTAFVGLIVLVPVIGYATWHGYEETINANAFPRHSEGITAKPRTDNVMKHDPVI